MTDTEKLMKANVELHNFINILVSKYSESGRTADTNLDLINLLALTKAKKTHAAILLLCEKGYGEDAMILCRSILELTILLKYIIADPTGGRANRYIEHDWLERSEMYENLKERSELSFLPKDEIEAIKANGEDVKSRHGFGSHQGWSDKTMYEMAKEVGEEESFNTCYKIQCAFSHSSSRSVNEYISRTPEGNLVFDAGASDRYVNFALASAFDFYKSMCGAVNSFFGLGLQDELVKVNVLPPEKPWSPIQ